MSLRRDALALLVPVMSAGLVGFGGFALLFGLDPDSRELATWYSNGRLRSVEQRCSFGRSGLCLYWRPDGSLDERLSGTYRLVGQKDHLDPAQVPTWQPHADPRLALEARLLREVVENYTRNASRLPMSMIEVRDAGLFRGSHSIPRDPLGIAWEYRPETGQEPAQLRSRGTQLVCEFTRGAPACHWRSGPAY